MDAAPPELTILFGLPVYRYFVPTGLRSAFGFRLQAGLLADDKAS